MLSLLLAFTMTQKNYVINATKKFTTDSTIVYNYGVIVDRINSIFIILVLLVTINVINYSKYYIEGDPIKNRFFIWLIAFVLSMLTLAVRLNIFITLLGWDALGLTSYILVNYYQNNKSTASATITILINRLGDVRLIICVALLNPMINTIRIGTKITIISITLIMIASIIKSAQFPFRVWLPEAIAAPTPVSSLVHSSTLVTAGVFLLMRYRQAITEQINKVILIAGLTRMIFSSYSAYGEFNIKKVIALSTLRQLGLIFIFLGSKLVSITMFHLTVHAFFKRILFMLAGTLLHNHQGNLDTRWINRSFSTSPLITATSTLGNIALIGAPFYSGFFSKDLAMEIAISNMSYNLVMVSIIMSIMITIAYSCKLLIIINSTIAHCFTTTSINSDELLLGKIIFICALYSIYSGSLYIMLNMNITLHAPIFFSTKYYIIVVIASSLLTYIVFWNKDESNIIKLIKSKLSNKLKITRLNKMFSKISSTSYFIKNVWSRSTNISWPMKNIMTATDINSLNKLIGHTLQLLIKKTMNTIIINHNNYLLTIFMAIILITIII